MSEPVGHGIRTKIKQKEARTIEINITKTVLIIGLMLSTFLSYFVFEKVRGSAYDSSLSEIVTEKFTSGKVTRCSQLKPILASHCIKMLEESIHD